MQTYDSTPDHGSALPGFYHWTDPKVTVKMLFGEAVPAGSLVYEIGRTADDYTSSWGDLQLDIGMTDYQRLYYAAAIRNQPDLLVPNNVGDPLYTSNFGMTYGGQPEFDFNTLILPKELKQVEQEFRGSIRIVTQNVDKVQKVGEAFPVMFIAQNNGDDGIFSADVYANGELVASKLVALDAGQFRVVSLDVTLEAAGTYELTVCGLTATVVVE